MNHLLSYILISCSFILAVAIFGFSYHRLRVKLKNAEIEHKMNEILALSEQNKSHCFKNDELSSDISAQNKKISKLTDDLNIQQNKSEQMSTIVENLFQAKWNTINILCNEYFEKGNSDITRNTIINDIEKEIKKFCNPDSLKTINDELNNYMDNIMQKLRNQCPQLKEEDYTFLMLIYAGFAPRAVCIFTNIKLKNYYNKRTRLIERIARTDAVDKELFINRLRQHPKY